MRLLLLLSLLLCGCSYTKPLARVPHLDGSGYTEYRVVAAGGALRPGVIVVVAQTVGSNAPVILTQANGPPMLPNLFGNATGAAAGLFAGYAIGHDDHEGGNTTVIQGDPREGPIVPPVPNPSSRPPFGPPPWHGQHPHNKGK